MVMKMDKITLAHGNGGKDTQDLLKKYFFSKLPDTLKKTTNGVGIDYPDDGAIIDKVVVATDSHTVNPYFFPGGSIGKLAVTGTINDVVMMGGRPIAMLDSIVVGEGFPLTDLDKITNDMVEMLKEENVPLVGGDFKVVPTDSMKGIVINTVGIGIAEKPIVDRVKEGDSIIVTGPVGVHGAVIVAMQYGIETSLKSDLKPLTKLLEVFNKFEVHAARDPTRGGLAATLNEWAQLSGKMIVIEEDKIPIPEEVNSVLAPTGLDPLSLANEGIAVLSVPKEIEDEVVKELNSLGFSPSIIGKVLEPKNKINSGIVVLNTAVGGSRILEMPTGELVPRIC